MKAINIGYDAKRVFHNRTGLGNYSRDLIEIMAKYHPDNRYVLYNPKPAKTNLFPYLESSKNVIGKNPPKGFNSFFFNYWRQIGISKDLIKDNINLFHGLTGEIPIGVNKIKIPIVVTIHDLIFLRFPKFYSYFDYNIHTLKAKHAVNNAHAIVAVSEQTKRDIVEYFNISPDKIKVIYQKCQDVFRTKYSGEEIKNTLSKFNLPRNYILNVGTIEERKNVLKGLMAIKDTPYNMVIVGSETHYTQTVKQYIANNKMTERVFFPKNIPSRELAMIYQGASLFLYPSLFEGFGIPIVEALYSGIPVVTSTGGCFAEAGGPHSLYIDPKNEMDIKRAVETIESDSALRKTMIEEGAKYVERFNSEYIANELSMLYQSLL